MWSPWEEPQQDKKLGFRQPVLSRPYPRETSPMGPVIASSLKKELRDGWRGSANRQLGRECANSCRQTMEAMVWELVLFRERVSGRSVGEALGEAVDFKVRWEKMLEPAALPSPHSTASFPSIYKRATVSPIFKKAFTQSFIPPQQPDHFSASLPRKNISNSLPPMFHLPSAYSLPLGWFWH